MITRRGCTKIKTNRSAQAKVLMFFLCADLEREEGEKKQTISEFSQFMFQNSQEGNYQT